MYPELVHEARVPTSAVDLGDGYVLMRARERSAHEVQLQSERLAVHVFLAHVNFGGVDPNWHPWFKKWARLRLPTGQITRTAWKECPWEAAGRRPRRSRMVRVSILNHRLIITSTHIFSDS